MNACKRTTPFQQRRWITDATGRRSLSAGQLLEEFPALNLYVRELSRMDCGEDFEVGAFGHGQELPHNFFKRVK